MVGFEKHKSDFDALNAKIVTASVDPIEKAQEVADEVSFPVGYGVTRDIANALGSWWEERRQIIQPTELVLSTENKVMASSYSDGPLGRFHAEDVLAWVNFQESLANK